jgi:Skp family chaperone for outer membrane proteins
MPSRKSRYRKKSEIREKNEMRLKLKNTSAVIIQAAFALSILLLAALAGCNSSAGSKVEDTPGKEIQIGMIDTDKLLNDYPDYKKFAEKKEKAGSQVRSLLSGGKPLNSDQKGYIKKSTIEYMKNEEEIIKNFVETVREASKKVADEKKLDMVLKNAESEKIIEYGGTDVTSDVQAKMTEIQNKQAKTK